MDMKPKLMKIADKKYELVKEDSIIVDGHTLYRIRALKDFSHVKADDLGGYIEKEENLSHEGDCWIANEGRVYGDASVEANATIDDIAVVKDQAIVTDMAYISDEAVICNKAMIRGLASVTEDAVVGGEVDISDISYIDGNASIKGEGFVCSNTYIGGDVIVNGHERIDFTVIRSTDYVTYKDPFADDVYYTASTSRDIWLSNDGSVCIGDNKGIPSESFIGRCVGAYENNTDEYLPISRVNYIKGIVENHKKLFNID